MFEKGDVVYLAIMLPLLIGSISVCVWAAGGISQWTTWGAAIGGGVIGSALVALADKK